jgi:hypothetical protein
MVDIVSRLKINGQTFSAELRRTLGEAEREFGTTGSVIGRNLSQGIGGGLQDAANRVPVLGGALAGLSGTALVAAAGLGAVTLTIASGIGEADSYQSSLRELDAVLKSTGNNTGLARDELVAFANDMEGAWAVSAEAIMKAEQVLATFDGVAGTVFTDAITLANDLAAVYGGDLTSNSQKLGTVLQNLAQGEVDGLSKAFKFLGVDTLEAIEALAEAGKTAEAQRALIDALRESVGGAGEAKAEGLSGAFFRLSDAVGDATRELAIGTGAYDASKDAVDRLADSVNDLADRYKQAKSAGEMLSDTIDFFSPGGLQPKAKPTASLLTSADDPIAQRLGLHGMSMGDIVATRAAEKEYERAEARRQAEQAQKDAEAAAKKREQEADRAADRAAKEAERRELARLQAEFDTRQDFSKRTEDAFREGFEDRLKAQTDLWKAEKDAAAEIVAYRKQLEIEAAEDFADILTDLIGGKAGRLVGDIVSLAGGGRANDPALDFLFKGGWKYPTGIDERDAVGDVTASVDKLTKTQEGLFGLSGEFTQTLTRTLAAAGLGGSAAGLVSSSKEAQFGGMAGGAIGEKIGEKVFKSLGDFAGPLGSIAGGLIGGALGSAFKKVKWGASTISFSDGEFSAGAARGNSGSAKQNATASANSVVNSLEGIIEQLGGSVLSAPDITIGQRHGDFRVNTSGTSLKVAKGAMEFDKDQQGAVEYAIKTLLAGAVIDGISDASKNIFKSTSNSVEEMVTKAGLIEAIPKSLKARLDPVGAAIDALNDKWEKTVEALREGGASAEQMAEAQRLYNLELEDVKNTTRAASANLKDFLQELNLGGASPLSLRDQEALAKAALQPFLDKIASGSSIDQEAYQDAAQKFLDIERQLYGSTAQFFAAFDEIQAATTKAIAAIDNAVPIGGTPTDPFAEKTATATQTSAQLLDQISGQLQGQSAQLDQLISAIQAAGGGGVFIGGLRSF